MLLGGVGRVDLLGVRVGVAVGGRVGGVVAAVVLAVVAVAVGPSASLEKWKRNWGLIIRAVLSR